MPRAPDRPEGRYLPAGLCCVESDRPASGCSSRLCRLDRAGEFGERVRHATMHRCLDAEFVMAAPDVLHERVTTHDHPRGPIAFQSAHRSQAGLEAAVVAFDPVVRVLLRVMKRAR